ncbi:MAG: hypothetical protein ACQESC_04830 [Nanobdellota archaeon]
MEKRNMSAVNVRKHMTISLKNSKRNKENNKTPPWLSRAGFVQPNRELHYANAPIAIKKNKKAQQQNASVA